MSRSVSRKAFRARVAFLLLSFALISSACAGRDDGAVVMVPGSYTGVDGVVSDTSDASRIVTLSGDLTEFVFELGAGDSVVATDLTTVHPEAAVSLPKTGIGRFLSAEAVLKHDPTLVIGDTQTSPQSAIDQIRAAGVPFIILEVSTTFDIMYSKIDDLGLILGAEEAAASLASRLESDIEALWQRDGDTPCDPCSGRNGRRISRRDQRLDHRDARGLDSCRTRRDYRPVRGT